MGGISTAACYGIARIMTHIHLLKSLDGIRNLLRDLPTACEQSQQKVTLKNPLLTKPKGSLGRLEELAHWASGWQHLYPPKSDKFTCHVYAGNHGIADKGVSAFPQEATGLLVRCFQNGQATIKQLCQSFGIELQAHPLRLENKTTDFTQAPALSEEEFTYAFNYGMNSISRDCHLAILGEMGIGNTTAASAIAHALFGGDASLWVGRGSGIDDATLTYKTQLIREAVQNHKDALQDPLDILRHFGGYELVAIAGAVIGARIKNVPVMLDGLICTAAAAPPWKSNRKGHWIIAKLPMSQLSPAIS